MSLIFIISVIFVIFTYVFHLSVKHLGWLATAFLLCVCSVLYVISVSYLGLDPRFLETFVQTVKSSPWLIVGSVVIYFVIGLIYTFWKYGDYISNNSVHIKSIFEKWCFLHTAELFGVDEETRKEMFVNCKEYRDAYGVIAKKSLIYSWMTWWPILLIYTISHRPTKYIMKTLYEISGNVFEKIFKRASHNALK